MRKRTEKKNARTHGLTQEHFKKKEREGIWGGEGREGEQRKRINNAVVYHQLNDAHPVSKQQQTPTLVNPHRFIVEHDAIWYRISLWPVRVRTPGCVSLASSLAGQ